MSECWHYIRFGTISDGIITGMHCMTIELPYPEDRDHFVFRLQGKIGSFVR